MAALKCLKGYEFWRGQGLKVEMTIPDIQAFSEYRPYLKALYELNRTSRVGSFRYYAQKLNWPISYMNEVISGKKKLTLNRALQLGLFLKLDAVDIERLIYLTLKDSEEDNIRTYFSNKVSMEGKTEGYFNISEKNQPAEDDMMLVGEEIFSDISLLAIADVIALRRGQVTPQEIIKLLYSFPELQDEEVLESKFRLLESKGIIQRKYQGTKLVGFSHSNKRLAFSIDRNTVRHMAQYADNYSRIICAERPRGWITSGFVILSKDRLGEAKKRILAFRNWLLSLENEVIKNPDYNSKDVAVFQMDVNLISILDMGYMGIGNLDQWIEGETSKVSPYAPSRNERPEEVVT